MSSSNTWACVFLACFLVIGALAYPRPDEDGTTQKPRSPCIPDMGDNDTDVYHTYSPNNFLPPVPGDPIEINMEPSMVSIHDGDIFLCGGVLVSEWIVVASEECLVGLDPSSSNYYIHERMGYSHRDHGGCVYLVSDIAINGNIGVLKTMTPVYLVPDYIETSKLATEDHPYTPDAPASVIGWGHPKREDREGSEHTQLHNLTVYIKDDEYCTDVLGDKLYNSAEMLCATGHDGCTGSSPVFQDDQLIAVVPSEYGCGQKDYPVGYTSIAYYYDWIQTQIQAADSDS